MFVVPMCVCMWFAFCKKIAYVNVIKEHELELHPDGIHDRIILNYESSDFCDWTFGCLHYVNCIIITTDWVIFCSNYVVVLCRIRNYLQGKYSSRPMTLLDCIPILPITSFTTPQQTTSKSRLNILTLQPPSSAYKFTAITFSLTHNTQNVADLSQTFAV